MIKSFKSKHTETLFRLGKTRKYPPELAPIALRKLDMLDAAVRLSDLRSPPGNHLEALSGQLAGKHSIRINKQWRIVFEWQHEHAYDVEIIDYH